MPSRPPPLFNEKRRLLTLLTLVVIAGFLATSFSAFLASRDSVRDGIAAESLPLTGDSIYSEIQKDLLRPVFISSQMAHDTFLRDWMLDGEENADQIRRYLAEIRLKNQTVTSFLVSARTLHYYNADGLFKQVSEGEPRDAWFFRVRDMAAEFETNVDADMANRDTMTIFINYKVFDYQGRFLGATGVGLTLGTVARLIDSYETRFQRRVFFVDRSGHIVLTGRSFSASQRTLSQLPGYAPVAPALLAGGARQQQFSYAHGDSTTLVNSRFIPELGWFLVVEENDAQALAPVHEVLWRNLTISAVITLIVLAIALYGANRYQSRLEQLASTDRLTRLLNRQAFDLVFQQAIRETERDGSPLSAILLDLDHFKAVNDRRGHQTGDQVLRQVAELLRDTVRDSDVVARWGGEEFVVLLRDCPEEEAARLAELLRSRIASEIAVAGRPLSASLGVAEHERSDPPERFFARLDALLYRAKAGGRNQVAVDAPSVDV
ncbi:sensor domain-containing diguanylate cyclase [Chitinolyticbacter meiyuanensis]|uniref:sensor domain-containing diguanylate cyclase n=1 Tax=Chitinolyticbacter meiyuanensis TaxID=682798 RepID=UPI0011E5B67C|nr:sensor domain-containing diguanylate cyclase [Chitinolyticbacter meiyuanensis]